MRGEGRRFVIGTGFEIDVAAAADAPACPWALIHVLPIVASGAIAVGSATVTIRLSVSWLKILLDNSPLVELLLNKPLSDRDGIVLRIDSATLVWRVADELRQVTYDGAALQLFLKGKTTELLVEGMSSSKGEGNSLATIVRDLLLADPTHPPSVTDLSAHLGVPPRKLGSDFKAAYGMTIPEWLAEWRLIRGHDLIVEGSAPIADVAASLGYAHLSTFTAAFSKRFGVAPTRARAGKVSNNSASRLSTEASTSPR